MNRHDHLRQAHEVARIRALQVEREHLGTHRLSQELAKANAAEAHIAAQYRHEAASMHGTLRAGAPLSIALLESARAQLADIAAQQARARTRVTDAQTRLRRQQESHAAAMQLRDVADGLVADAVAAVSRSDEARSAEAAELRFLLKWEAA
ncbi:hypothetical protein [Paraburkholderia sp. J10-1]|uniref:hypothetical protein n=1 Tax=Paraburkholderia sp. J10-1 TaxID=2805430 RepID=UPI002AB7BBDB|nr:hypothetical protein [Paraburkholderia sp. J10-1]